MAAKSDYYDILGVSKSATKEEIKKAYRKQALEWHPDRHKDEKEAAERRFKEINEAYQVLYDSQKRSAYDQFGHAAFSPGGGAQAGGFAGQNPFGGSQSQWGPFTYTYTTSGGGESPFAGFDFGDPFDIFEQFFGGSPFGARQRQIPRYSMTLDFMEAVKGTEKKVTLDSKEVTVKIPKGVDTGSIVRFKDYDIVINVTPDSRFKRDGYDLITDLNISIVRAALGDVIAVPTVDGPVNVIINIPQKLNNRQKELLKQLGEELE